MSLLAAFVQGGTQGISDKWADNREDVIAKAKEAMAGRLQDRATAGRAAERAAIRGENLAEYNDPNSLINLQAADSGRALAGEREHELDLQRMKSAGKNTLNKPNIKKVKKNLISGDEVELMIDTNSGLFLNTGDFTRKSNAEDIYKQLKDDQSYVGTFGDGMTDKEADGKLMAEAEEIASRSSQAHAWGIDPSRFVDSFGSNQGLLSQQAGSQPLKPRQRTQVSIKEEDAAAKENESTNKAESVSAKKADDELLARFGLNTEVKKGKGLLDTLTDDPVIGGVIGSYQDTSRLVDYVAGKGIGKAKEIINTKPEMTAKQRKRYKDLITNFPKNPSVEKAKSILTSGLVTGDEKRAYELWIKRNK